MPLSGIEPKGGKSTPAHMNGGKNLTHYLLETLGNAIVTGEYSGRHFPNEGELVKEFGISRSVTREAVKMLGAKGLLGARPKIGTYILPEDQWNLFDSDVLRWLLESRSSVRLLRHFTELRIAVEPQAAALAAVHADSAALAGIKAGLHRMAEAEEGRDNPLEADIAFHVAILRASNNPFINQLREAIATALKTSIRFTNQIVGHTASVADHGVVLEAIERRDPNAARAAMEKLIIDVRSLIEDDCVV